MFEKLKERYEKKWARKDQIARYVELGAITEKEYEIIVGEPYEND